MFDALASFNAHADEIAIVAKSINEFPEYSWRTYAWVSGISFLGGMVSYLGKVRDGRPYRLSEFIAESLCSWFVGLLTFYVLAGGGAPPTWWPGLVGLCAHMGTRVIFIAQERVIAIIQNWRTPPAS